jgi:hypothetical protein
MGDWDETLRTAVGTAAAKVAPTTDERRLGERRHLVPALGDALVLRVDNPSRACGDEFPISPRSRVDGPWGWTPVGQRCRGNSAAPGSLALKPARVPAITTYAASTPSRRRSEASLKMS